MNQALPTLTLKDFATDQEVRWCPGCGDYAILKTIQKVTCLSLIAQKKIKFLYQDRVFFAFSLLHEHFRLSYYTRSSAGDCTGVKLANPELDVWVITGDGDGFSIGGNHMMHAIRRNVNLQILL